jgi:hypothetical protein
VPIRASSATGAGSRRYEAFSGPAEAIRDWDGLFATTEPDQPGSLEAAEDDNADLRLDDEPDSVRSDLAEFRNG